MKYSVSSLLIFSIFLLSCKTYNEQDLTKFDDDIKEYISLNKLNYNKSNSGLYYKIINEGEGNYIQVTDSVKFTYEGRLFNGEMFDKQTKPMTFHVKDLIQGWKEIIVMSKPGAAVELIVPPHLGYGNHDLYDIPPNSILLFKMKIISIL